MTKNSMSDKSFDKRELALIIIEKLNMNKQYLDALKGTLEAYRAAGDLKLTEDVCEAIIEKAKRSLPDLLEHIAEVYVSEFEEEDLAGIASFLSSKVGEKYTKVQIGLDDKCKLIAGAWARGVIKEAYDLIERQQYQEVIDRGINPRDYIPAIDLHLYWQ